MKKTIGMLLSAAVAISALLTSCSEKTDTDNYEIRIISPAGAIGGVALVGADKGFSADASGLSGSLPSYVNEYPYSDGGRLFEVDDGLRTMVSCELSRFLEILYGVQSEPVRSISFDEELDYQAVCKSGGAEFRSMPNCITILADAGGIDSETSVSELLENGIVSAGLQYLGISDPVVTKTYEYSTNGEIYCTSFRIAEKSDDEFGQLINNSFHCMKVQKWNGSENIAATISNAAENADSLKKAGDCPILSSAAVLDLLSVSCPELNGKTILAEIYYSASVQPGYFIPCYRFYVESGSGETGIIYETLDAIVVDRNKS